MPQTAIERAFALARAVTVELGETGTARTFRAIDSGGAVTRRLALPACR